MRTGGERPPAFRHVAVEPLAALGRLVLISRTPLSSRGGQDLCIFEVGIHSSGHHREFFAKTSFCHSLSVLQEDNVKHRWNRRTLHNVSPIKPGWRTRCPSTAIHCNPASSCHLRRSRDNLEFASSGVGSFRCRLCNLQYGTRTAC